VPQPDERREAVQTLQDFVVFPSYNAADPEPNPPFNQKGLVDVNGNRKPAFAVLSSSYHATQQVGP